MVKIQSGVDLGPQGRIPVCNCHVFEESVFQVHGTVDSSFDRREVGHLLFHEVLSTYRICRVANYDFDSDIGAAELLYKGCSSLVHGSCNEQEMSSTKLHHGGRDGLAETAETSNKNVGCFFVQSQRLIVESQGLYLVGFALYSFSSTFGDKCLPLPRCHHHIE